MVHKNSFIQNIIILLVTKLLQKIRSNYTRSHNQNLPIILVAGTVGKSSQTLILSQFFTKNSWKVYTGTSQAKNYNTITGLAMTLLGKFIDLDGGLIAKIKLLVNLIFGCYFTNFMLPKKTILIYEVGFDHQNESWDYLKIFKQNVDVVVLTSLTHEHAQNFDISEINKRIYNNIAEIVPEKIINVISKSDKEVVLKNIVLEQLNLLKLSKYYIIPSEIEIITNSYITNIGEDGVVEGKPDVARGKDFALKVNSTLTFNSRYLLPETFAKFGESVGLIGKIFDIDSYFIKDFIKNVDLPNSRFSLLKGFNKTTIVDSTYNSDPASMISFFDNFRLVNNIFKTEKDKYDNQQNVNISDKYWEVGVLPKHYFVLGEMRELGEVATREHEIVLDYLVDLMSDFSELIENVYLVGKSWLECDERKIQKMDGIVSYITYKGKLFKVFTRSGDLKKHLIPDEIAFNSWMWCKGSQNTIFLEEIVKHILHDKSDVKYLCRQSHNWLKEKEFWAK